MSALAMTAPVTKVDEPRQRCQLHRGPCREVNWLCFGIQGHVMICTKCARILQSAKLIKVGRKVAGHPTWELTVERQSQGAGPRRPYLVDLTPEQVVIGRALGYTILPTEE